jgi:hypothetical protein
VFAVAHFRRGLLRFVHWIAPAHVLIVRIGPRWAAPIPDRKSRPASKPKLRQQTPQPQTSRVLGLGFLFVAAFSLNLDCNEIFKEGCALP